MRTSLSLKVCLLILALLGGAVLPVAAATDQPLNLRVEMVNIAAFPQVTLHLSAWGENGLSLGSLNPADFLIYEEDLPAFAPNAVEMDTSAPLAVMLVLDVSSSMQGQPLEDAKIAAARFLDKLDPGDQAALIAFSDNLDPDPEKLDAQREAEFTTNLTPIYDRIEALSARGGTHLYNALTKAVRMTAGLPSGHRAILLLSDGRNDPADLGDPDEPIQLAQAAGLPVYVISLGNKIDEPYLRRLASETGGLYLNAPSSSELASMFSQTAGLLKTQYQLSYLSQLPPDGREHSVRILLRKNGAEASAAFSTGRLPQPGQPTATPTPTLLPTATATPTLTLTPRSITPTSTPPQTASTGLSWAEILLIAAGILLLLLWIARRKRAARKRAEYCANCGYDLTGHVGPCPQCKSSARRKKN